MKSNVAILAFAMSAAAAPITDKRQSGFDFGSLPGGMGSSIGSLGGLGSLGSPGSSGSSVGSLGSIPGSSGTGLPTGSSLGSFGSLPGSSATGSSLGSLGSLPSIGSSGFMGSGSSTTGTSTGGSTSPSSTLGASSSPNSTSKLSAPSGNCKAVTFLFARGTGEPATMGYVIGPPLAKALAASLGDDKVSSVGVDYPASAAGNGDLGASGGRKMAEQANGIISECPATKLVLGGYSQGAMVVHNALSAQGLDGSKVAAVVAFGDPFNGQEFKGVDASKVKEFCGKADTLCSSGGASGSGSSHLDYGRDADAAAQFIVSVVGK